MPTHLEPFIRAASFLVVLAIMLSWQKIAPRNTAPSPDRRRIPTQIALAMMNAALVRVIAPLGLAAWAVEMEVRGWGLLNTVGAGWPFWLRIVVSLLVFDLVLYAQHLVFHKVPLLWRFHKVHHTDTVLDVTTGIRFHPGEILLSLLLKGGVLLLLGAPAVAVVAFEVLLNATTLFNHANGAMRPGLDRVLRLGIVTPDMHRVHHSVIPGEFNSNFGFNLPWWDRFFGTYRHAPANPLATMDIGVAQYRTFLPLVRLLRLPLTKS